MSDIPPELDRGVQEASTSRAKLLWRSVRSAAVTCYVSSYVVAPLITLVHPFPVPFGVAEGIAGMGAAAFSVLFYTLIFGLGLIVLGGIGAIGGVVAGMTAQSLKQARARGIIAGVTMSVLTGIVWASMAAG